MCCLLVFVVVSCGWFGWLWLVVVGCGCWVLVVGWVLVLGMGGEEKEERGRMRGEQTERRGRLVKE